MTDNYGNDMWNRRRGSHALARVAGRDALTTAQKGVNTLAKEVREGRGVHEDAKKIAVLLATYGEGDRVGRYAFAADEVMEKLEMTAHRLRDAVAFLEGQQVVETTHDGAFEGEAAKAGFYEVKLTAEGRGKLQVALSASADGSEIPDVFGGGGAPAAVVTSDLEQLIGMLARAGVPFSNEGGDLVDGQSGPETHIVLKRVQTVFVFDIAGKLKNVGVG